MLFKCDHCGVEFDADPSKIPNPKVKLKCISCKIGHLGCVSPAGDSGVKPVARAAEASAPLTAEKGGGPTKLASNLDETKKMLTQVKELPSLPFVGTKLMELTASPNTTMRQMEELILKDSALASKVLKYSNSALYGRAGQITTMRDALVLLGFSTVKTIAIASSVKSMHSSDVHGYSAAGKTLWAHSVETGICARLLAKRKRKELMEEAFIVGLLHDIGKSVIETKLPGAVQNLVALKKGSELTFEEIEQKVLGIGHSELGAILCRKWNFPEILEKAIRHHHNPNANKSEPILSHLACVSDAISYHLSRPPDKQAESEANILALGSSAFLHLDQKTFLEVVAETQETVERDKKTLDL